MTTTRNSSPRKDGWLRWFRKPLRNQLTRARLISFGIGILIYRSPFHQFLFVPPNLYSIAKSLASTWLVLSGRVVILIASIVSWLFFHPTLEQCVDFKSGWIFEIYARNSIIITLFAGGLHLYFYTFKMQGNILRFDSKDQVRANSVFTFQKPSA